MKTYYAAMTGNDGEKQALRGNAPKWSVPCVIHSRKALNFYTRLVFTVTLFTGFGVIFASIWFMMDCRQNFNEVEDLIPRHSSFCTNLGMQALFACCVLLFTIFGLGCIGRRMTGHAILIISGVAIFQGAMTLVFYQCRAMADDDIMSAVNSTMTSCRVGPGAPFATATSHSSQEADGHDRIVFGKRKSVISSRRREARKRLLETNTGKEGIVADPSDVTESSTIGTAEAVIEKELEASHALKNRFLLNNELKRKLKFSISSMGKEKTQTTIATQSISSPMVECSESSRYFVALARNHDVKEIKTCVKTCQTYKHFCLRRDANADSQKTQENATATRGQNEYSGVKANFNGEVTACGEKITQFVRHFCIYDSRIFTPLSLGTPIFYIFMSICFIYLAYCDRQCKDDDTLGPPDDQGFRSRSSPWFSRRSLSKVKDKRRSTDYSSSLPALVQQHQRPQSSTAFTPLPSPAQSDISSTWGTDLVPGRKHLAGEDSPPSRLHSTSARTLDTVVGDD